MAFGGDSSTSNPQTSSNTQETYSVAGASGANAPTVFSLGDTSVAVTDGGQTKHALDVTLDATTKALDDVTQISQATISGSLGLLSDFNAREAQAMTNTASSNVDLLKSVLANNQELANNVQSGGATTGMATSSKIIYAALAMAGLIVAIVLFRK